MEIHVKYRKVEHVDYEVKVGHDLAPYTAEFIKTVFPGKRVLIGTDSHVFDAGYPRRLQKELADRGVFTYIDIIPAGESHKTPASFVQGITRLASEGYRKGDLVLAVGGGVVTDLYGWVASNWGRNSPWIAYSSSINGMVDAAEGGKTGGDIPFGADRVLKNMVGRIHQPSLVVCDLDTLVTLPAAHYRAGSAEIIKYGLIKDAALFREIERDPSILFPSRQDHIQYLVERSAGIKARVVSRDPEEKKGLRNILNYGHTLGHALEAVTKFTLLHGEAVAIGMVFASRLSERYNGLKPNVRPRLVDVLEQVGLPTKLPDGIEITDLVTAMKQDKKSSGSDKTVTFTLAKGLGHMEKGPKNRYTQEVPDEEVIHELRNMREVA